MVMKENENQDFKTYCVKFRVGFAPYLKSKSIVYTSKEVISSEGKRVCSLTLQAKDDTEFFEIVRGYSESSFNYK